jgi:hypothetical protein
MTPQEIDILVQLNKRINTLAFMLEDLAADFSQFSLANKKTAKEDP